ncbi:MAG: SRPBCC family protein [Pseudomonadota bacterium]
MDVANEIVRTIVLKAAITKVWQAISDARQFEQWFRCKIDGTFQIGEIVTCYSTYEDSENFTWQKRVVAIEPERYFAFNWTPGETGADMYKDSTGQTMVEFELESIGEKTQLVIRESGFADLPEAYRARSFRINTGGWDAQVENITVFFHANN